MVLNSATEKPKRIKKVLKATGISVAALIIVVIIVFFALFHNEVATIMTVEQTGQTDLFTMEYKNDYGLDDFLEVGASTDAELVGFISKRMLKGIPLSFELPDLGCSTFLAKTPDNDYIFGRNFDNKDTPVLMLTTKPENGYKSLSVVNLSFIGYDKTYLPDSLLNRILILAAPYAPLDGINEKGVSIGVLQLDSVSTAQESGKVKITTTAAIRLILDKAANVDEAIELLKQYDMRSSAGACYHFQISDASGRSVVIEYVNNELVVLDEDYATNFYLAKDLEAEGCGGYERYDILKEKLESSDGILTADQGMELLEAVKQGNDSETPTQWSVVYNNTSKTARLCLHMDYGNPHDFKIE